jgi:hypothetical protein
VTVPTVSPPQVTSIVSAEAKVALRASSAIATGAARNSQKIPIALLIAASLALQALKTLFFEERVMRP